MNSKIKVATKIWREQKMNNSWKISQKICMENVNLKNEIRRQKIGSNEKLNISISIYHLPRFARKTTA